MFMICVLNFCICIGRYKILNFALEKFCNTILFMICLTITCEKFYFSNYKSRYPNQFTVEIIFDLKLKAFYKLKEDPYFLNGFKHLRSLCEVLISQSYHNYVLRIKASRIPCILYIMMVVCWIHLKKMLLLESHKAPI